jgi:hypothetical protein
MQWGATADDHLQARNEFPLLLSLRFKTVEHRIRDLARRENGASEKRGEVGGDTELRTGAKTRVSAESKWFCPRTAKNI